MSFETYPSARQSLRSTSTSPILHSAILKQLSVYNLNGAICVTNRGI